MKLRITNLLCTCWVPSAGLSTSAGTCTLPVHLIPRQSGGSGSGQNRKILSDPVAGKTESDPGSDRIAVGTFQMFGIVNVEKNFRLL